MTPTFTETASQTPFPTPTFTHSLTPSATPQLATNTPSRVTCPGTQTTRLYPGDTGVVLGDDPRPLRVRNGPSASNTVIVDLIETGERFEVIEGPRCGPGLAWLRIRYRGQQEGWIAEGDPTLYFVGPDDGGLPQVVVPEIALRPNCRLIVEEEFASAATPNDWFLEVSDRYTVAIRNGAYTLIINTISGTTDPQGENQQTLWGSLRGIEFDDASIEALVAADHFTPGGLSRSGLWLRYQGDSGFLAFMIRGDGAFRVARWSDGEYTDLFPWTRTDAILIGDSVENLIRVDTRGDQHSFFVNGELLTTVQDDTWTSGRAAFWGSTSLAPATFTMSYFRACEN
jgi:hypothetical protein